MLEELLSWLSAQNSGLRMHKEFRRRTRETAQAAPDQAALLYLLAGLSRRFESFVDDAPLPANAAAEAHRRLIALLRRGVAIKDGQPEQRLALLNEVAVANLLVNGD